MVNPIGLAMIVLGVLLLLLGIVLVVKRMKIAGMFVSLLGLGAVAVPFVTSFFIASSTP